MQSFWNRIRLRWLMATRSMDFGLDLSRTLYKIYLNHDKIVHFRDGLPVVSLMTPALLSKPAAHFISRALYKTIQNKNTPNLASLAVNDECNARCEHCSFYEGVDEPGRHVLTLEEWQRVISDAQDLGVSIFNFVGGEPLVRKDFDRIVAAVDKDRSATLLYTNGAALSERAGELRRAGLDSVFVSLSAASPDKHDKFFDSPGIFQRALAGIETAKRTGMSVGISASVSQESWDKGELQQLVELGRDLGVHEVFVFDVLPAGRYTHRRDLVGDADWTDEMVRWAEPLNNDSRYPGITFHAYMSSHRSVACSCGTSYFYLSPYGDMMSCDFNHASFGNVLEQPLWQVWENLTTHPTFQEAKWGGCKVRDEEYRDRDEVCTGRPPQRGRARLMEMTAERTGGPDADNGQHT